MSTGADACALLKWDIDPVGVRLSLPPGQRDEAVRLYMKMLRLCDNSKYAPWSTSRSLATTLMHRETLPPEAMEAQKKLLENWNYNCSAGTINMRLYLLTAGYLAAEQWPDFKDSAVRVQTSDAIDFRGKEVRSHNAEEIQEFCRSRIYEIFRQFTVQNLVEHDVSYFQCDLEAVKMLADFAKDPEMRKRAAMVMDYFMLQLAAAWNQGYDAEPWFRIKSLPMQDAASVTEKFGWLYFGTPLPGTLTPPYPLVLFGNPGYRMPGIFESIARDRGGVREVRSSQFDPEKKDPEATIWKTFFHTPAYSLSSAVNEYDGKNGIKTGLFKEERMLNLTWISGRPGSNFFVFQENIRQPYFGKTENNDLGAGENPYSQRMQDKRTALGVYDVPESYPFYRQYTIYRKSDVTLGQIEKDGWVFTHTGKMLFGFYSMMPTTWERNRQEKGIAGGIDIRWCDSRRNAWIVETADADSYPGDPAAQLAAFAEDVLRKGLVDTSKMQGSVPELSYKSIHGDTIRLVYSKLGESVLGKHFVNGTPLDYRAWKTHDSPWATQDFNSPIVTVNYAGTKRIYNFEKWIVEEAQP